MSQATTFMWGAPCPLGHGYRKWDDRYLVWQCEVCGCTLPPDTDSFPAPRGGAVGRRAGDGGLRTDGD